VSYEFEIDHANGILIVQHQGTLDQQEAYATRGELVPLLLEHGIKKILIDLRDARIEASAAQIFEFQSTQS
jgi:hypothetical protein